MKALTRLPGIFVIAIVLVKMAQLFDSYKQQLSYQSYMTGRRSIFDEDCATEDAPAYAQQWFLEAENAMTGFGHTILSSEEPCLKAEHVEHFVLNSCRSMIQGMDQCRDAVMDETGKKKRRLADNPFN
jgi:hypothetical protein